LTLCWLASTISRRADVACLLATDGRPQGALVKLLIAIPVYNERQTVNQVLDRILQFHPEILVVDDGSTDGTSQILELRPEIRVIRHPVNCGYGRSVIDAFDYAGRGGFDWVITMDCDEQHEPESIPAFMREIQTDRWDLISGSRYLQPRGNDDLPPSERRTVNAAITAILNTLLPLNLSDAFCGFKAHRVSAMRPLQLDEAGYAFPMQLWPRAARAGLRITEIPVRLIYNDPNRHFGGLLDDASYRLKHYIDVLRSELDRPSVLAGAVSTADQALCSGCGCG
jgi:glycosyltransferase involved in cell wall biosynthesis